MFADPFRDEVRGPSSAIDDLAGQLIAAETGALVRHRGEDARAAPACDR